MWPSNNNQRMKRSDRAGEERDEALHPDFARGHTLRQWSLFGEKARGIGARIKHPLAELQAAFPDGGPVDQDRAARFLQTNRGLLNAVCYADIFHRLARGRLDDLNPYNRTRVELATEVLRDFLAPAIKPGSRELATVVRAVGILEIPDRSLLTQLARDAKRALKYSSAFDLAFIIGGMSEVRIRSLAPEAAKTLQAACETYRQRVESGSINDPREWTALLGTLSRARTIHPALASTIVAAAQKPSDGQTVFDSLDLDSKFRFLLSCWEHGHELPDQRAAALSELTRVADSQTWAEAGLSAVGIGEYAMLSCLTGSHIPAQSFCKLEAQFNIEARRAGELLNFRRILAMAPAVALASPQPHPRTYDLLQRTEIHHGSFLRDSPLEREVGEILAGDLGLRFDREVVRGPYRLDFLVTTRDGRVVNLESDGDLVHLLYDIEAGKLTGHYISPNLIRDTFLRRSLGIPVARILGSELRAAADTAALVSSRIDEALTLSARRYPSNIILN